MAEVQVQEFKVPRFSTTIG